MTRTPDTITAAVRALYGETHHPASAANVFSVDALRGRYEREATRPTPVHGGAILGLLRTCAVLIAERDAALGCGDADAFELITKERGRPMTRRVSTVRRLLADLLRAPDDITMTREAHAKLVDQANYSRLELAGAEGRGCRDGVASADPAARLAIAGRLSDSVSAVMDELNDALICGECQFCGEGISNNHGPGSDGGSHSHRHDPDSGCGMLEDALGAYQYEVNRA